MSNTDLIKELRALTQAGMKDCKESLEEAGWDLQRAVDIVKTKGLNIVSGREGKVASEGAVMISNVGNTYAMVEVNCQTDFVANSPDFRNFATHTANVLAQRFHSNEPFATDDVEPMRKDLVSTTKENIVVRRWWAEQPNSLEARTYTYVHSNNKIGVLLTLQASIPEYQMDEAIVTELGNDLAMQIAAMSPLAISVDRLDPDVVTRQKAIFEAQLTELNKPQAAWAKILEGKFNKWYTEVCLLNQESVVLSKTSIQQVIKNVGTKLGGEIQLVNFIRCQVGEGIEKQQSNLADEVAKMM